jgi:D-alanyl-D-alanine dipeptidase
MSNFLNDIEQGKSGEFFLYSPKGYYLKSFESGKFIQCSRDCICICQDEGCLGDRSYCKDINKPIKKEISSRIGIGSLLITNNADSYDFMLAQYDSSVEEITSVSSNCSGEIVQLEGSHMIRASLKPAFEEAQKYAGSLGKKLIVTSAYRTPEKQSELLAELGPGTACTPRSTPEGFGMNCPHVRGCALDVHFESTLNLPKSTQNEETLMLRKIMEHAGFTGYPLDSKDFEFWHFNYGISVKTASSDGLENAPGYAKER